MKTISMLEFRKKAEAILNRVRAGQGYVLTYRGKPVARLEPIANGEIPDDDPLYMLPQLAVEGGESISNEEIDRIVYGI